MDVRSHTDLVEAVERCYRAAESERARSYRGGGGAPLALILQREVQSSRAGVCFSIDPLTYEPEHVLVEAVFGHGERLVAGEVDPDRYWVPRTGTGIRARVAYKSGEPPARRFSRTLRDDEALAVADLVLQAEQGFARPVDVEFCFEGADPWLVQCRPITTLRGDR